jgi:hypothetical protein
MKKTLITALIGFFSFVLNAQETKTYELLEFNRLIVQGRYNVQIEFGEERTLKAVDRDPEISLDALSMSYAGKTLTVKIKGSLIADLGIDLVITLPEIDYIEAKHGCDITFVENFAFDRNPLHLHADTGGKIYAKNLNAPWIKADAEKGAYILVKGKTVLFEASVIAGGTIEAKELEAKKVTAEISFGGEIKCHAVENLDATVTSGGTIYYKGEPAIAQHIQITGNIESL